MQTTLTEQIAAIRQAMNEHEDRHGKDRQWLALNDAGATLSAYKMGIEGSDSSPLAFDKEKED